jgi:hypothetical protein
MRIQMAKESRERKAADAAALKASNDEMERRLASARAAYLTSPGSATGYSPGTARSSTPPPSVTRTIQCKNKQSPSQQFQHKYYPVKYSPVQVYADEEPTLW